MDDYHKAFIYASEFIEMDAERKADRAQRRK
ncbi:hypothetical protein J2T15_001762 [Paenibacillus harenae]|uniref:YfhE family protein n=1 Tax=Paenibacillus harenae TaxID=306543 RepID=A0ABT9TY87_PAEHA|nr:hypothetical protein [Paenibacillus harenae]MDQ0112327.1 hypothetical protein [Paenibacillus harenae]